MAIFKGRPIGVASQGITTPGKICARRVTFGGASCQSTELGDALDRYAPRYENFVLVLVGGRPVGCVVPFDAPSSSDRFGALKSATHPTGYQGRQPLVRRLGATLAKNVFHVDLSCLFSVARRATFSAHRRRKRLDRYARQNEDFVLVFSTHAPHPGPLPARGERERDFW